MKNLFRNLNLFTICILVAVESLISSCEKDEVKADSCFADVSTERRIQENPARISVVNSQYYIVEENTIDTRLRPCNLDLELQIDGLFVTVSGDVKKTPQEGICCTDNFVITKISKR